MKKKRRAVFHRPPAFHQIAKSSFSSDSRLTAHGRLQASICNGPDALTVLDPWESMGRRFPRFRQKGRASAHYLSHLLFTQSQLKWNETERFWPKMERSYLQWQSPQPSARLPCQNHPLASLCRLFKPSFLARTTGRGITIVFRITALSLDIKAPASARQTGL